MKAQDLDSRINRLEYDINNAERIKTEFRIMIVGRNPRGDEYDLAVLEKDDALRTFIANHIVSRLVEEREKLKVQFSNL